MKKDIHPPLVTDVALAVVKDSNEFGEAIWNIYLLNLKKENITHVLVTSKGYGNYNGEEVKTSTLRHFFENVPAQNAIKIEPIIEGLFGLNNEYLLSFYINKTLYDKKYVFLAESIQEENLITLPILHKKGVMIK
ncbi:MAG: hypothetical protein ABI199_10405 [Bacteroidia bacterium]